MKALPILAVFAVFLCGCATERYITDARHPEIAITAAGGVTYRGKFVEPEDLPDLLEDSGFTKDDTINIHVPDNLTDMRLARRVMGTLSRNGFRRPILLTDRKSYTEVGLTPEDRRRQMRQRSQMEPVAPPPARRTIRYK